MKARIWYPQLDVYDAVRRIALILRGWSDNSPVMERLYIADFYLANPALLHRVSMPQDIRKEFQKLKIKHPDKLFLSYPAAPILFHKMEPIQKQAIQAMVGKGILDSELVRTGRAKLSSFGEEFVSESFAKGISDQENIVLPFIISCLVSIGSEDTRELRKRTGLRRMI